MSKLFEIWLKKIKNIVYGRARDNTKINSRDQTIIKKDDDWANDSVWDNYFNDKLNGGE